jgi:uroporphyrinogen decarboxylase
MQGPYGPHLVPPLERKLLSETADHVVIRDEEGNVVRLMRDDPLRSMPEWIEYPMKDREDWDSIVRPRLDAKVPGRCPGGVELEKLVRDAAGRDYPLGLWCGSFYGWPRSLMGVERMSLMLFDDPGLIHEMCEHIADFVIQAVSPLLDRITFDFAYVWEDMAGKAGPLWLEAGVTGLRPFEAAAGCDPVAIRRRYGRDLVIQGGIDKRALAGTRQEIEREVLRKVPWLSLQGGYFPQVDHLVPPDVSLENYAYYSALVRAVVEEPDRFLHEARRSGAWNGQS